MSCPAWGRSTGVTSDYRQPRECGRAVDRTRAPAAPSYELDKGGLKFTTLLSLVLCLFGAIAARSHSAGGQVGNLPLVVTGSADHTVKIWDPGGKQSQN